MSQTAQTTVGEFASRTPATVRVFQKYGIDFCCGGKLPLEQACRERGIEAGQLLAELENAAAVPAPDNQDWNAAPLAALIDHILEAHHTYLKTELPRLAEMSAKVAEAHGASHGDSLGLLCREFQELKGELESHMWKEEMVLFPLIVGLEHARAGGRPAPPAHCGSVNNPIRVMEHEHDSAGKALAEMRRATGDYTLPPDACNTWRALFFDLQRLEQDLHQHIHLENNILFPRASELEASL